MIVAMQTADKHKVATPADWQPGDDVIVPPPAPAAWLKSDFRARKASSAWMVHVPARNSQEQA